LEEIFTSFFELPFIFVGVMCFIFL